ncbi:hypothetical protein BDR05DRAFT_947861 [Suillus weaverae]|nr:hypothetical protein BDR05DRAFT_947861 [Suillus weaverae]
MWGATAFSPASLLPHIAAVVLRMTAIGLVVGVRYHFASVAGQAIWIKLHHIWPPIFCLMASTSPSAVDVSPITPAAAMTNLTDNTGEHFNGIVLGNWDISITSCVNRLPTEGGDPSRMADAYEWWHPGLAMDLAIPLPRTSVKTCVDNHIRQWTEGSAYAIHLPQTELGDLPFRAQLLLMLKRLYLNLFQYDGTVKEKLGDLRAPAQTIMAADRARDQRLMRAFARCSPVGPLWRENTSKEMQSGGNTIGRIYEVDRGRNDEGPEIKTPLVRSPGGVSVTSVGVRVNILIGEAAEKRQRSGGNPSISSLHASKWTSALQEEFASLKDLGIYKLVLQLFVLTDHKIIWSCSVFKLKCNQHDDPAHFKAQNVCKGVLSHLETRIHKNISTYGLPRVLLHSSNKYFTRALSLLKHRSWQALAREKHVMQCVTQLWLATFQDLIFQSTGK